MKRKFVWLAVGALALAASGTSSAQPRPSEADIFGAPAEKPAEQKQEQPKQEQPRPGSDPAPPAEPDTPTEAPPAAEPATTAEPPGASPPPRTGETAAASTPESTRDDSILGAGAESRLSEDAAPEDPLKIGGMFYLQTQASARQGDTPDDWALRAPALLDAFLDARPNERVRGFILGRMSFDPTLPADSTAPMQIGALEPSGASMGAGDLSSLFGARSRGPAVALDQMWLRFDIAHTVFVTAGKQHARWGTARFWSPTDFLHVRRRNPLDVFDARTGTTMLKLHAPWEAQGWNLYAYGLLEDAEATPTVGDIAGAARAEIVLGTTEIGLGGLVQNGRKPKLAVDASTGVWDLDLYGELALRYGSEIDRVVSAVDGGPLPMESFTSAIERLYPIDRDHGVKPQVVGGLSYARKYNDNDVWNFGVEYFYNALGYDSPEPYPGLVLPRGTPLREPATFFYLGRHYGAVFLNIPAPYSWDYTTFTLSTLGNLSDGSYISRLDYSLLLLTHLRFEAFAAVRFGSREGEFRLGVKDVQIGGRPFSVPPGLLDLGLALRVSI